MQSRFVLIAIGKLITANTRVEPDGSDSGQAVAHAMRQTVAMGLRAGSVLSIRDRQQ